MVRTTNRYDLINPAVVSFDEDDDNNDDNDYDYDNENENDDELIYSTFDEYVVDFDASSFSSSEENDDAVITEEFDGQEELLDVDDTSSTDEIDVITEELGQELLDVLTNLSDDDDGGGGDCFNNNTMGATHTDEEKNPINISIQVSDIVHEYDESDIELMKEGLSLLIDDDKEMVDADDDEDDEEFMAGFLGTATTTTATTIGLYPSLVPQVTFDEDEDVRTPSTPTPWLNGQLTSYYVTAASSRGTTYTTSSKNDKANEATRHQHWSQQEDEKLKIEVYIFKQQGSSAGNNINWEIISNSLPSRSAIQCKCRWNKYLQPTKHYGKWEKYEDECILTMKRKGYMWADIASRLERRTGDYIRDRYVNYLDPNIKKATWTEGEDKILFKYQRILGNKWSEIQKLLPGPGIRPQNSIKNRYNNRVKAQNRRLKVKLAFKSN